MSKWKWRLKQTIDANPDLTMKGVSLAAGLSETVVRDIIVRERSPQVDNFLAIARVINVDPCWLLTGGRFSPPKRGKAKKLDATEVADFARDILEMLSVDEVDPLSKIAALRSAANILDHFITTEADRGRLQQAEKDMK